MREDKTNLYARTTLGVLVVFVILCEVFLSGCADTHTKTLKPYYAYRAEMLFTFGGNTYEGLAVTKLTGPIDIQIYSPITLNRVEISTCSRHEVIRNTTKGWFDSVKNTMVYRYIPTAYELEGHCPIHFQAFNDHVQKAWGMIAFRNDQTMPARMDCNGVGWSFSGISMCQTKAGLEQQLVFKSPTEFEATPECKIETTDKLKFQVRSTVGWCKATFTDGKEFHDLIQLGYEEVTVY